MGVRAGRGSYPAGMDEGRSVLTIGNFDGVHEGHRSLVRACRGIADASGTGAQVVALAFDPHPASRLRPGTEPLGLSLWRQRERWLLEAGADRVERLEPTPDLLDLSPEAFVESLVEAHRPIGIVEGADFRFGKARAGDMDALRAMGVSRGFGVTVVDPVEIALSDGTVARASSTLVRWLVSRGRVTDASAVLGRAFEIDAEVTTGDRRGRTIGYPTANLALASGMVVPADGVYAGEGELPDGRTFGAAISVGTNPHFGGVRRRVEAHLLDCPREGASISGLGEYGWRLRLRFWAFVRDQGVFPSLEALLGQMERDCAVCRECWNAGGVSSVGGVVDPEVAHGARS